MWDEVNAKFKPKPKAGASKKRKIRADTQRTNQHIIVQRGLFSYTAACSSSERCFTSKEHVLLQPQRVKSNKPEQILGAVEEGAPTEFTPFSVSCLQDLLGSKDGIDSATLGHCGDKHSSNVCIFKATGKLIEEVCGPALGYRVNYVAETCLAHLGPRIKKALPVQMPHITAHYRQANLHRQESTRSRLVKVCDAEVGQITRKVRKPENRGASAAVCIDILFDFDAPHHKRPKGGESEFLTNLRGVAAMQNTDLLERQWGHDCWDAKKDGPFCNNTVETKRKTRQYVHDCLFVPDPIPAESTWTHTLRDWRKTTARECLNDLATKTFCLTAREPTAAVDIDGGGDDSHVEAINGHRIRFVAGYLDDSLKRQELPALTQIFGTLDKYCLYPVLGNAYKTGDEDRDPRIKIRDLIDPRSHYLDNATRNL